MQTMKTLRSIASAALLLLSLFANGLRIGAFSTSLTFQ